MVKVGNGLIKKAVKLSLSRKSRLRNAMITINNPTTETFQLLDEWQDCADKEGTGSVIETRPSGLSYLVGQSEKALTFHYQLYIEMNKRVTMAKIKEWFEDERIHVERRRGTQSQAIAYCKKEDTRMMPDDEQAIIDEWALCGQWEWGIPKMQGCRTDLKRTGDNVAKSILDDGANLEDVMETYPAFYMMNKEKVTDFYLEQIPDRKLEPNAENNFIFYGPSGCGKTTEALRRYPNAFLAKWVTAGRWWQPNTYQGQEVAIFEEFKGTQSCSYVQMLGLLDIHPNCFMEFKGGSIFKWKTKCNVITTTLDPKNWYVGQPDRTELERRIRENCTIFDTAGGSYPNFKWKARDPKKFKMRNLDFSMD